MNSANLLSFLLLLFFLSCQQKQEEVPSLPVIDLNNLEEKDILLSDLVDDFEIYLPETSEQSLISNVMFFVECGNSYLIATQEFPGAARLYRFDMEGNFLNEIGHPGRGPGEHDGYYQTMCLCLNNKEVIAQWIGSYDVQRFDLEGQYLGDIQTAFNRASIYQYSDSIWFTLGRFADKPQSSQDSVRIVFQNTNGKVLSKIPRKNYPPKGNAFTHFDYGRSLLKRGDDWVFYSDVLDTIFYINDMQLEPRMIIKHVENHVKYNQSTNPNEVDGNYYLNLLTENNSHILISKNTLENTEIREYSPGQWGGSISSGAEYLLSGKEDEETKIGLITDDIFHMFDKRPIESLKWDDERAWIALPPVFIKEELLENLDKEQVTNPKALEWIEKFETMSEEDNPVIFIFKLKEEFNF